MKVSDLFLGGIGILDNASGNQTASNILDQSLGVVTNDDSFEEGSPFQHSCTFLISLHSQSDFH